MRPRLTLAGQLLALQLTIIVLVLIAVTGVSLAQFDIGFRQSESQRMRAIAETGASTEAIRVALTDTSKQGILPPAADRLRALSGADYVVITDADRRILASPNPTAIGDRLDLADSPVLSGQAWTGMTTADGHRFVTAHVPVVASAAVVGVVATGRRYPPLGERLITAAPSLLVYLGIAGVLGVAGSLLLARRVKRQTLGLEPVEITRLVEHREAMLHGIKEGVIGLDTENRVTLISDAAIPLLGLPSRARGRRLEDLAIPPGLYDALTEDSGDGDRIVAIGDRIVTLNRMPLVTDGEPVGSVTTMRDRTDLIALRNELDVTRTTTEALRAQAHEFSNQLHAIAGLLELQEYDEVRHYVSRVSGTRAELSHEVTSRVADPSVAALLIAKGSLATEQGCTLRVHDDTSLGPLDEDLSADLVTVVGNLVDNGLEAARPGVVEVQLTESENDVAIRVRDSGAGVPDELREKIFQRGFSTKDGVGTDGRGFGLALIRVICERRGGRLTVESPGEGSSWGTEFVARLPRATGGGRA